jgi:GNAT superfamily N-acetyltransferase
MTPAVSVAADAAPAITVIPASAERWADVVTILGRDGERGCWCQYYRMSSGGYARRGPRGGERALRGQVAEGDPSPGIIAYADGEPAGWLGLWPRSRMERLVRSRTIPVVDDVPVWSIVCFNVRVGFRRKGVSRALLQGAIRYAREQGAPALEAYPVEPGGQRVDTAFGYVGFVPMFEAAGFRRVVETASKSDHRPRILMRLDLTNEVAARTA